MLCKKCGAQIDDNATVCEFCGETLATPVIVEEVIEPTEETVKKQQRSTHEIFEENKQKRQNQTQKAVDEKQQQLHEINERREQKRKREKRNRTIVILVVCLIVAAAAATAAYLLKGQNPDIEPTPVATPVATLKPTLAPTSSPGPEEATPTPDAQTHNENAVSNQTQNTPQVPANSVQQPSATNKPTAPTQSTATQKPTTTVTNNGASRKGTGGAAYKTASKTSGVVNTNITSALAVGGEVITDNATNKPLMTFVTNNTTYYAYVSPGSVTSMINGKYITVTAAPTTQTYNGNTIYDISSLTYYDADGYIVPDSGVRYLTKSDLSGLTKKELGIARNEIYARHGRSFKIKEYSEYFNSKSWYKENPKYNYNNEASNLNKIELKNVDLILSLENQR